MNSPLKYFVFFTAALLVFILFNTIQGMRSFSTLSNDSLLQDRAEMRDSIEQQREDIIDYQQEVRLRMQETEKEIESNKQLQQEMLENMGRRP